MNTESAPLAARWSDLRRQNPRLRIRAAAAELGVSEAELLATDCGRSVTRLEGPWNEMIRQWPTLGEIMSLTRNDAAIHESYGAVGERIHFTGELCQVIGPPIDLRLFLNLWHAGFAVTETKKGEVRRSLQFFDADGTAVHKIHLTERSHLPAYEEFVERFRSANQSDSHPVAARRPVPEAERPDSEVDVEGFRRAWLAMGDSHEFSRLLKTFRVSRPQAMRLAPPEWAQAVALGATGSLLEAAAAAAEPIMVFVRSPGCIQIHSGPIQKIKRVKPAWLNVHDERFNLHLDESKIVSAWIVKKPVKGGHVTSLELLDAAGGVPVLFFGKRSGGEAESRTWRSLLAKLPVLL